MFSVLISSNIQNRLGERLSDCEKEKRAEERRGEAWEAASKPQSSSYCNHSTEKFLIFRGHITFVSRMCQDDVHWLQVTVLLYRKAKFKFSVWLVKHHVMEVCEELGVSILNHKNGRKWVVCVKPLLSPEKGFLYQSIAAGWTLQPG